MRLEDLYVAPESYGLFFVVFFSALLFPAVGLYRSLHLIVKDQSQFTLGVEL